jgi:hypothetical protein
MAKHHNIVKKPKLILPAIGSALQTGASAFGKRAGLLLANKLFGVETEGFGFKKKNKKPKMVVKPKFLKAKVTKTKKGFTKRKGVSGGDLGFGTKENRKATAQAGKSYAAQTAGQLGAYALGASAGGGAAIGLGAAGARTGGNLAQQAVAKRRVKKFGQAGSAIVPNKKDVAVKAFLGEKTRTHKDAAAGRKSARNFRKAFRAQEKADKFSRRYLGKPMAKFPDLSGDGKVTQKDILIGRGVIDKPKMLVKKRKDYV